MAKIPNITNISRLIHHLNRELVGKEDQNVLSLTSNAKSNRPETKKNNEIFIENNDGTKRLSVYINGRLYYVALTEA